MRWSASPHLFVLFLLFLLFLPAGALGEEQDPGKVAAPDPLATLIAGSQRSMTLGEEGFTGAGATFLLDEGKQAQFFLIGESHGNVETPELARWLAGSLKSSGYAVLAVEVGPVIVEKLKQLATRHDAMAAFQGFHEALPFSVPFFFWREEVEMLVDTHRLGYDVWGLDQEFIGAGRFLLSRLDELVQDEALRKQVDEWQAVAAQGMRHFAGSGETDQAFLNVVDPAALSAFAEHLPQGAAEARRITVELRQSAIVYQHYRDRRYYRNNYDRIRLMKTHLAQYIAASGGLETTPRAIFKFGSSHMGRGYSPLHQLDLGNAAAELAAARFSDSFHVNVSTLRSVGQDGKETDWTENTPGLALFGRHLEKGSWGIFDLRELRQHFAAQRNRDAQPELAKLVFRYDALALAPAFHAATPMIPLPF